MTTYYEFRSEKEPKLRGLTDDPAGDKLPADNRPWTMVRQVTSEESWSLGFSKAASIAGVAENGFFLWDKKAFNTRWRFSPSRHTPSYHPVGETCLRAEPWWLSH